jgi:hypothetical protein
MTPTERLAALETFFQRCWDAARLHGGCPDGADIQDWDEELGLLKKVRATEACGEGCVCADWDDEFPTDCYRPTRTAAPHE